MIYDWGDDGGSSICGLAATYIILAIKKKNPFVLWYTSPGPMTRSQRLLSRDMH